MRLTMVTPVKVPPKNAFSCNLLTLSQKTTLTKVVPVFRKPLSAKPLKPFGSRWTRWRMSRWPDLAILVPDSTVFSLRQGLPRQGHQIPALLLLHWHTQVEWVCDLQTAARAWLSAKPS